MTSVPGVLYSISGRTDIGEDLGPTPTVAGITLTIDPGVIVMAQNDSRIVVNRGNKIDAVGTPSKPIIFTSRANIERTETESSTGSWGGIVLMGRAPLGECNLAPLGTPGTATCQRDLLLQGGLRSTNFEDRFGGGDPADDSGRLQYVQIRYAGSLPVAYRDQVGGLTLAGVGSGTTIDNIQIHNSGSDGVSFQGGGARVRHLIVTGATDDSMDHSLGDRSATQFAILIQQPSGTNIGDSIIESDGGNSTTRPAYRTSPRLINFTFRHWSNSGANAAAVMLRSGTKYGLGWGFGTAPSGISCIAVSDPSTLMIGENFRSMFETDTGPFWVGSIHLNCGLYQARNGAPSLELGQLWNSYSNNTTGYGPVTLINGYINGAHETEASIPFPGSATFGLPASGGMGAVLNVGDNWPELWACSSVTANFGAASKPCLQIPIG